MKSRRGLPSDQTIQYVYEPNAEDRHLDQLWRDYVNLSVTAVNPWMFRFSCREHPGAEWVILEFGPEILGGQGVVFDESLEMEPLADLDDLIGALHDDLRR